MENGRNVKSIVSLLLGMVMLFSIYSLQIENASAGFPPPNAQISMDTYFWDDFEDPYLPKWTLAVSPGNHIGIISQTSIPPSDHQDWFLPYSWMLRVLSEVGAEAYAQSQSCGNIESDYIVTFEFTPVSSSGMYIVLEDDFFSLRMNGNVLEAEDSGTYQRVASLTLTTEYLIEIRAHVYVGDYEIYLNDAKVYTAVSTASHGGPSLLLGDNSADPAWHGDAIWDAIIVSRLRGIGYLDNFEDQNLLDFTIFTWQLGTFEIVELPHGQHRLYVESVIAISGEPYPAVSYGFSPYFDIPDGMEYVISFDFMTPYPYNVNLTVLSVGSAVLTLNGQTLQAYDNPLNKISITTLSLNYWHHIEFKAFPTTRQYLVNVDGNEFGPYWFVNDPAYKRPPSQFVLGCIYDFNADGYAAGEAFWDNLTLAQVKINEVMFDPLQGNHQWVELYNKAQFSIDISGWQIADEDYGGLYEIPSSTPEMPPQSYVVIHFEPGDDDTYFGQTQNNALHLYAGDETWERFLLYHDQSIVPFPRAIGAADFDDDGHAEVVSGNGHCCCSPWMYLDVSMYKHSGNPKNVWGKNTIDRSRCDNRDTPDSENLALGYIDNDLKSDVVVVGYNFDEVVAYRNNLPSGWEKYETSLANPFDVSVADIDGDDLSDIVVQTSYKTVWYKNDGSMNIGNWDRYTLRTDTTYFMGTGDLDKDGYVDVVTTTSHSIIWLENQIDAGKYENWDHHVIEDGLGFACHFEYGLVDVDKDYDLDVVAAGGCMYKEPGLYWYENDGSGYNWNKHTIDKSSSIGPRLEIEDIDHDTYVDALVLGTTDAIWYENKLDASPPVWEKHHIDKGLSAWASKAADLADLDNDGLVDVMVTDRDVHKIYWYTRRILEVQDQLSLYIDSEHTPGAIIDFVAWGADSGADDDNAVEAEIWPGGEYVDTSSLVTGQTIGRDSYSTDTDTPSDWMVLSPTKGYQNP